MPAAKANDPVVATDTHIVLLPPYATPTPLPHPFTGVIDGGTSGNVNIDGQPAATVQSSATNMPAHVPQGGPFQTPPSNRATLSVGSTTVFINGLPAARAGDTTMTCNDPADAPVGTVLGQSTVMIG